MADQSTSNLFTLRDLLHEQMRDLFDAETQYLRLLPEMAGTSTAPELKTHFETILVQTRDNLTHLAHICTLLDIHADGVTCEAMKGLVREAKGHTYEWGDSATLDAALISNAQRIVHYEMAGFGTAKAFARCLRLPEVAEVLSDLLDRAFANDKALTRIATGTWLTTGINQEAAEVPVHG